MKQVRVLLAALVAMLVCVSASAFAQEVRFTEMDDGRIAVKGKGFTGSQRSYEVNIYVNDDRVFNDNTDAKGGFEYTTRRGAVRDGDRVIVKVFNYNGPGGHYINTKTIELGHRPPRPSPAPSPAPTRTPAPAPEPTVTDAEIRAYANRQARRVANNVAETYGALERWRSNFVTGFWVALSEFQNADVPGYPGSSEYTRGRNEGSRAGAMSGGIAGQKEAWARAQNLAPGDVRSRFEAVVDQDGVTPDTRAVVPSQAFEGLDANLPPVSLEPSLDELDAEFQRELERLAWSADGWMFGYSQLRQRWTLRMVYGYQGSYRFVEDWFRADFAYDEWRQNRLGGNYDYRLYRELNSSQRETFRHHFRQVYDQEIDERFWRVVRGRPEPVAQARGLFYGRKVGFAKAYKLGHNNGFAAAYLPASREAFHDAFTEAYRSEFDRLVAHYESNPVVELKSATLFDANANGVFEAGEKLGARITRIVNLGRVEAKDLPVALAGESITSAQSPALLTLPPLSSNKASLEFAELAQVNTNVVSDRAHQVRLSVGRQSLLLSFSVSWKAVLELFGQAQPSSGEFESLRQYLLGSIRAEWLECLKQGANWYNDDNAQATRLGQLVSFYDHADPTTRQAIKAMYQELWSVHKLGGGLHPWKRSAYRKLVERMR